MKVQASATMNGRIDNFDIDENQTWQISPISVFEVQNLTVLYNGKIALENIDCKFLKGTLTGVIGPNGAGKSTLFKAMLGLVEKKRGELIAQRNLRRQNVAYVEQRSAIDLTFPISVFEVVLLGTYPSVGLFHRAGKREKYKVIEALKKVQMLSFAQCQIGELSGGQLQRVFMARALAQEAEFLLLDEPFIGIDAASEGLIMDVLKQLQSEGKTIAIVHHDLHKVREYFSDIILMNRMLIAQGPVNDVFTTENIKLAYGDSMGDVFIKGV